MFSTNLIAICSRRQLSLYAFIFHRRGRKTIEINHPMCMLYNSCTENVETNVRYVNNNYMEFYAVCADFLE